MLHMRLQALDRIIKLLATITIKSCGLAGSHAVLAPMKH